MTAPRQTAPDLLGRLEREAHLWLTPLPVEPEHERAWRGLLSAAEQSANDRIRVAGARRQHLAARALVRTTLSRYAEVEPRRWRFATGAAGRPELAGPAGAPPLRFNLAHAGGLVACVVTLGVDSGVDVEHRRRQVRDPLAVARHSFAPAERRALAELDEDARRLQFLRLWTLKEAYVKARGAGFLALPARRFAWQIDGRRLRLEVAPELADEAGSWQAALLAVGEHLVAVAIARGARADLHLASWRVTPLAGDPEDLRPELLARTAAARAATGAATASG